MQRVVRSTLVGLLAIAGLTACGDKVTVPGITTTTVPLGTNVISVTVSPANATLNIGDKITLAASVNAEAGVTDRTVTWTSADPTIAGVDANGVVSALKAGNTSIVAASKANPSVKAAAAITVNPVNQGAQASVTISSVNQTTCSTNGVCSSVPANLSNVQGQLDVVLNVDPGSAKLSEVDLIMNCGGADTIVQRQILTTGAQASVAATSSAPVTLSFNTAQFNATTGATAFKNGACTLKAKAITSTGTTVASTSQSITLANVDFISTTMTTSPTGTQKASATDNKGLVWNAGAVNVTVVPVIYTANRTIAAGSINLINGGGDNAIGQNGAVVGPGGIVASQSNLTPSAGLITAVFPNSTTAAGGVGGATVDTLVANVTTVDAAGQPGPTFTIPTAPGVVVGGVATTTITGNNFIRLDNLAPPAATAGNVTVNFSTQNASNGFVGSGFSFATGGTTGFATVNAVVTADNGGVDVVTFTPQYTAAPSSSSSTWTNITSASSIPETSSGTAYAFRYLVCDALNNCAATPALGAGSAGTFGVDVTAPRLSAYSGPKNLTAYGIGVAVTNGGNVTVTLTDSSGTGSSVVGSGFGPTPLLVTETVLQPSGSSSSTTKCAIGTPNSTNTACTAPILEPNGFNAANSGDGVYTLTVQAIDQAGNVSAATTVTYVIDTQAPVVSSSNIAIPGTITTGTAFSSTATDNLDVAGASGFLTYAGGTNGTAFHFFEPGTANPVGLPFDNVLTRSATVSTTLQDFYRTLAQVNGTNTGTTAASPAAENPASAGIRALDGANNLSNAVTVALPATNIASSSNTPYVFGAAATGGWNGFTVASSNGTVSNNGKTASTPTSTTLTATVTAVNATQAPPFTSVCFYFQVANGAENALGSTEVTGAEAGDLVRIGCTSTPPADVTSGAGTRTFTYQMPWTPSASLTAVAHNVFAVGTNANTDGIITQPVTVTIVP